MIGTLVCAGSGIARLGVSGFDFSAIPSGSVIESVRFSNLVISNQAYLTVPNTITIGFYADATITPVSALASGTIELVNGPARSDYASRCPVLDTVTFNQLNDPDFGVIVELDERGAVLIFTLDLIVEYTVNNASLRQQYKLEAIPDLPEELHEVLAVLMSIKASIPMASDEAAWTRLVDMKQDVNHLLSRVETENAAVNSSFITSNQYQKKFLDLKSGKVF